jgi:hypothetical protein
MALIPAGEQSPSPPAAGQTPAEIVVEVAQGRILIDGVEVEPEAFALQKVLMTRSSLETKLVVRSEAKESDRAALIIAVREAVQTIAQTIELSLGELRLTVQSPFEDSRSGNKSTLMVTASPKDWNLVAGAEARLKVPAGGAASEARVRKFVVQRCGRDKCQVDLTLTQSVSEFSCKRTEAVALGSLS